MGFLPPVFGLGAPAIGGNGGALTLGFGCAPPWPETTAGFFAGTVGGFEPSSRMSSSSGSGGTGIEPDFMMVDRPADDVDDG